MDCEGLGKSQWPLSVYSADSAVPLSPGLNEAGQGMGRGSHLAGDTPGMSAPLVAVIHSLFLGRRCPERLGEAWVRVLSTGNKACSHLSLLEASPLPFTCLPSQVQRRAQALGVNKPSAVIYHRSEPIHLSSFRLQAHHMHDRENKPP